uniref:CYP72A610 n=1 Tax=Camptotheca acuminata TaxID=16922 RepID=A0A4Y5UJ78_CAMAC|nr:CYP72A610 [Camptotheca acuminata]UNP59804.1 schizocycline synthase [Camptotheca acuminata]
MKMEVMHMSVAASLAVVFLVCIWRALNWAWFMPKKIEKRLRQQGFNGNPYRLLVGDLKESSMMLKEAMSKPIPVSQDIVQRLMPHVVKTIQTYGKNSFTWIGRMPRVHIMEPELIKDILANHNNFQKNHHAYNPLTKFLLTGIGSLEGEKWAKHRRIISPSFHLEKLKTMLPAFYVSYDELLGKWERESSTKGSVEVDLFPTFDTLTSDVISRVAFGSSYGEGGRIFILLKELMDLTVDVMRSVYVPGWSLLPTKRNQRMREVDREIRERLSGIINSRVKAMKAGEPSGDDLLGTLLESNFREIERLGNKKNAGMSIEDVISECKLFYFAGQETTGILLTWTCVILSRHPEWQERAREEIFQVFGNGKLDFDRVQGLKIVPMILYEVLRLYPPVIELTKVTYEEQKLGNLTIPAGVQLMMPSILLHRDKEMWGDDATEFNPGRFAEGVAKAVKSPFFYIPFSWGPRICVGQNFALLQAKMALAMILQRFSFDLSPTYAHAPFTVLTLQPQHGAQVIFRRLKC